VSTDGGRAWRLPAAAATAGAAVLTFVSSVAPTIAWRQRVLESFEPDRAQAAAHAAGLAVHVWTIDETRDMRRLLEWGVDGIVTDRPDRLARLLHEMRGRPLPPGPPPGEAEPWLERLLRAG
jgi:glycerophosphoryl diester phosphodiesterase